MGRKSKSKKNSQPNGASSSSDGNKQLSNSVKKEIMDNVKTLLDKCSQPPVTGPKEFEDYLELRELVEKIVTLQKDISIVHENREGKLSKFVDWLKGNKVDMSCVEIEKFKGFGHGLKASKDLKEGDMFLSIPRDLMMTPMSAKSTSLGPIIAEDKILQVMPSVALALHLLCEKRSPESKWKPYIDILPESYYTPLYFTQDDLKQLKGSPAFSDCISQYRNIARQYAYFYRLFHTDISTSNFPLKEFFTYEDYRWAVSSVMTRQNQIPTEDGSRMTFALIPLWDMCNHCNGLITTDFNIEKNCSECYSLQSYRKNDQVFIFYGARSNAELLVNNGFIYPENAHDRLAIKLGISKGDPSYNLKSDILTKCGLLASRTFYLHTGDIPIDTDLLIFLRIFSMDEESLKSEYSEASSVEVREALGDIDKCLPGDVNSKVWTYLETRATLLLKAYDTSIEEDETLLQKGKLSEIVKLCVQLRRCEKRILQTTLSYTAERKQKLQSQSEST